ncbi:MAG: hypothetical protein LBH92_06870 [Bacteroidales bacterium]|jgi:hypothetical protein|nr:hypothetical protein [Bacteroidales bacterium]
MEKHSFLKYIGIRLALLALMLFVFNFIYTKFFYENDLKEHSDMGMIQMIRNAEYKSDIIYIGESSDVSYDPSDLYKNYISQFISEHYPELRLATINKKAAHAGIYKVLLEQLPKDDTTNKVVIVTMNMRSFDANWIYAKLETPLQKIVTLLRTPIPLFNRFLLSFKAYDVKTDQEREKQVKKRWRNDQLHFPPPFPDTTVRKWDNAMAKKGIIDDLGNRNQAETELACHYIKAYAFQIDTLTNPRIHDFNEIIDLAEKRGWILVFNLLAENTQRAQQLVGDELVWLMRQNRDLLVDYYTRKGAIVVDNLETVDDMDYIDKDWTSEHYAEKGRIAVAQNVANSLKEIFPGKYVDTHYAFRIESHFSLNCETYGWGQYQTVTTEQAYSGEKSSKTGNGEIYSITFEWNINHIPDSCLNEAHISLRFFTNQLTGKDMALAMQFEGGNIEPSFVAVPISTPSFQPNQWELFEHTFVLPKSIKSAERIKFYVYNSTSNIMYVDDLDVRFE